MISAGDTTVHHLHAKVLEGVNEDLDLLRRHLLGLEGGPKGDEDGPLRGRVHELLQLPLQRLGLLQLQPSHLTIRKYLVGAIQALFASIIQPYP